jgi:hypothetical protein
VTVFGIGEISSLDFAATDQDLNWLRKRPRLSGELPRLRGRPTEIIAP